MSILLLICAVSMSAPAPTSEGGAGSAPQGGWKMVKKSSLQDADAPIRIVKVKAKGREIKLNEKFDYDDPDWLRDFTLTIENTSGKAITHVNFALFFPTIANGSTAWTSYTFELRYGLTPQSEHYAESRRKRPERVIKQKEKYDLSLSAEEYEHIRKVLAYCGYLPDLREVEIWLDEVGFDDGTYQIGSQIFGPTGALKEDYPLEFKQVEVAIERVFFGDGMMWYKSFYFLRDPNNPDRWIRDKHLRQARPVSGRRRVQRAGGFAPPPVTAHSSKGLATSRSDVAPTSARSSSGFHRLPPPGAAHTLQRLT